MIYASLQSNSYQGFAVSETFLRTTECQNCTEIYPYGSGESVVLENLWAKLPYSSLDRLNPAECIAAYGTLVQSARRNLLVVIADEYAYEDFEPAIPSVWANPDVLTAWDSSASESLSFNGRGAERSQVSWMCGGLPPKPNTPCSTRLGELRSSAQNWTLWTDRVKDIEGNSHLIRWPIEYCLSEATESRCQLHFSPLIAGIVTALNFCKSSAILIYSSGFLKAVLAVGALD